MGLTQAKTYGSVGAILSILGGNIPRIGNLISIIGFILILLAVKEISLVVNREDIFKDYLVAFILHLGAFFVFLIALISVIGITVLQGIFWNLAGKDLESLGQIIKGLLIGGILAWILFVLGSYYLKKSYESISIETEVGIFRTTGLLYFVGAILLIVFGIGALLIIIGKILEIVAYLSLPENIKKEMTVRGG
ncbi:DUF996 domain-containing protein [Thermococcus argininiproducens]|uniref:DUF996 domain-containing protein n=1 Tax=Thermococcus argininiproducens TaxID=2866384 RepID=A0A9E7SCK7_9EURY|nr:DUF996 domain-containing protein [Thermococcus argininiproducens]USG99904.1 DUF996 domain-containing protein [Thermococcus argininiproducens]